MIWARLKFTIFAFTFFSSLVNFVCDWAGRIFQFFLLLSLSLVDFVCDLGRARLQFLTFTWWAGGL